MGRRQARWAIAAAVLVSGCIPRTYPPGTAAPPARTHTAAGEAAQPAAARELTAEERRVRDLEAQLAERDRQIAAVQSELQAARAGTGGPAAGGGARPADAGLPAGEPAAEGSSPAGGPAAARDGAGPTAGDAELAAAQRQIASLEGRLASEVQRRQQVEREMTRLLEETSAGPYERSGSVVDQHLREQLASAEREIGELRSTLAAERRERGELQRRFSALQAQVDRSRDGEADSEEVNALKERQRRVIASIQQDLAASQQREAELRDALERSTGADGVSLADSVTTLRAENTALQRRLDEEHRQNRELAAKLKTAGRVTDLIFKMQSSGTQPAAATVLSP
jgi:chromosome segregation ATPase